jgi:hypothetical protein
MKTLETTLFADYFQFYLMDGEAQPPIPEEWTEEDIATMAKVAPNLVVVCPVRNMTVPVRIVVLDGEPGDLEPNADQVVECSLALPSGQLRVEECTGPTVGALDVDPGTYTVRILYRGLDTIDESGLEGEDHYEVLLWSGEATPLRVLKQWPAAAGPN